MDSFLALGGMRSIVMLILITGSLAQGLSFTSRFSLPCWLVATLLPEAQHAGKGKGAVKDGALPGTKFRIFPRQSDGIRFVCRVLPHFTPKITKGTRGSFTVRTLVPNGQAALSFDSNGNLHVYTTSASRRRKCVLQLMAITALCRICEPIAFMSIFPYIYFMISSFHITSSEDQISIYAGLVTSAFAFAEFSTGVFWGRLSDKIGRKPVLMTGLIGTLLSMLVFGFATNLPLALLGRALGGALNGNIGVLQTTVAEIVTEKKHQPSAYAIMPFVWSFGSILGPLIGGALAEPCKNYPQAFARGSLFDQYPFLLPNLVCALILIVGILVGILFLEETHQEKKYKRDVGLETGQKLLKLFDRQQYSKTSHITIGVNFEDSRALLDDEPPPGYRTTEGSPRYPSSRSLSPAAPPYTCSTGEMKLERKTAPMGVQKAFTKPVIVHIIGYGILA
ncbi:MAG: hypothetical protein Q9219_001980 [cf. Caloplaca sp. 3 TL-2023]